MPYTRNIEELRERLERSQRKREETLQLREAQKARVLSRRKLYAQLFEPHPCKENQPNGEPCTRFAIPGGFVCLIHGGDNKAIREAAKTRLLMLVEPALRVIRRCMASGDEQTALKAAMTILDRTGYKDIVLEAEPVEDLTKVSKDQLMIRAKAAMQRIHELDQEHQMRTGGPIDSDENPDGTPFPPTSGSVM